MNADEKFDAILFGKSGQDEQGTTAPDINTETDADAQAEARFNTLLFGNDQTNTPFEPNSRDHPEYFISRGESAFNSAASGFTSVFSSVPKFLAEMAGAAAGEDPESYEAYQFGKDMDEWVKQNFPVNPAYANDFWTTKVPQASGSFGAFIAGGALGAAIRVPTLIPALALGVTSVSTEFVDDYKRTLEGRGEDISLEDRQLQAFIGGLVGTSEAFPVYRLFNRLDRLSGGSVRKVIAEGFKGGLEELTQEVFQSMAQNKSAQYYYDPERNIWTGDTTEGAQVGFTVGMIFNTLTAAIGTRRSVRPKDEVRKDIDAEDQVIKEAEKRRDEKAKNGAPAEEVQKEEKIISDGQDRKSDLELEESLSPDTVADEPATEPDSTDPVTEPTVEQTIHEGTDVPEGALDASSIIGQEVVDEEQSAAEQDKQEWVDLGKAIDIEGEPESEHAPGGNVTDPETQPGASHDSDTIQEPEGVKATGEHTDTVAEDQPKEPGETEEATTPSEPVTAGNYVKSPASVVRVRKKQENEDGTLNVSVPDPERLGKFKVERFKPEELALFPAPDNDQFKVGETVMTPWGAAVVTDNKPNFGNSYTNPHDIKVKIGEQEFHTKTPYLDKLDAKPLESNNKAGTVTEEEAAERAIQASTAVGILLGINRAKESRKDAQEVAYKAKEKAYSDFKDETAKQVEQSLSGAGLELPLATILIDNKPVFRTSGGFNLKENTIHLTNDVTEWSKDQNDPVAVTPERTLYHEVGHWGFMNALSGEQRLKAAQKIAGSLNHDLILGEAGYNYPKNKFDDLDEYVAEMYSNFKRGLPTDERLLSEFKYIDSKITKQDKTRINKAIQQVKDLIADARPETGKPSESKPENTPRQHRRKRRNARKRELTEEQKKLADEVNNILKEMGNPGKLNSGVDPEQLNRLVTAGVKLGKNYMEQGIIKFADWADAMLDALDESILPHLKTIYNQIAGDESLSDEVMDAMDSRRDVKYFDLDSLYEDESFTPKEQEKYDAGGDALFNAFKQRLKGEGFKDNHALKAELARLTHKTPAEITPEMMKSAQEMLETAATELLRESGLNYTEHAYNKAVELYKKLPLLNVRSSTSSINQAYSTPAPLSWLASAYSEVFDSRSVLDTTAGNGALLAFASPGKAIANELNPTRVENLERLGLKPTNLDALGNVDTITDGKKVDRLIVNPPFDKLKQPWEIDGYKVVKLDHRIAAEALDALKDDGKAVLILGATKEPGGMQDQERPFFNWLYSHFNVVDHFEVDGDLYRRMGAEWPVRFIVIHGKQQSDRFAPAPGTIDRLSSWKELYERYTKFKQADGLDASDGDARPASGSGSEGAGKGDSGRTSTGSGDGGTSVDSGTQGQQTGVGKSKTDDAGTGESGGQPTGQGNSGLDTGHESTRPTDSGSGLDTGKQGQTRTGKDRTTTDQPSKPRSNPGDAELASDYQVPYTPRSKGFNEGILIPRNMAESLNKALENLEQQVGDIDQFVMTELGYESKADLHKAFMGLQVDAVAASIFNIKRGQAVIIADQTGVGKGRQAAAIQRYALRHHLVPVFITYKPNLFTDMYDELKKIGETGIRPFIVNNGVGVKVEGAIKGEFEYLYARQGEQRTKALNDIARTGQLPPETNALWLDYYQINRAGNLNQRAIAAIANRSIFVLDEAHNAAGDSNTGHFMRNVLGDSRGALYLSATWAKRPDNIPLYFLTSISRAVDNLDKLPEIMKTGGLPLQTIISSMLATEGQLFRRERSFKGIEFKTRLLGENNPLETARQRRIADKVTEVLRAIVSANISFLNNDFDKIKQEQIELMGGSASTSGNNDIAGTVNAGQFTSVTHNLIEQLLYGVKLDQAIDQAIAAHKRGEKPVIVIGKTFESFHNNYIADHGITFGQKVDGFGYHLMMNRATERSRRVTVKNPMGDEYAFIPPLKDLSPMTQHLYEKVYELIDQNRDTLNEMKGSPVDYLRYKLTKAGLKVDEITGRSVMFHYSEDGSATLERREKRATRELVDDFNNGNLDALIGNESMSTGLSIHASEDYKDQKIRHMIVLQADLDINRFMQILGRINRFGQGNRLPLYSLLQLNLPAEKRVAAILAMKMQSLNANTSSDTESDSSLKNVVDMLNKYGDEIIHDYLKHNPDIKAGVGMRTSEKAPPEDYAKKFLNRLALMPVEVQEQVFEEVEPVYQEYIKYLDDTNQNELKPKVIDLDAKVIHQEVLSESGNGDSVFDLPVVLQTVDVKRQGKPPRWEEVESVVDNALDGTDSQTHLQGLLAKMDADSQFHDKLTARITRLRSEIEQAPDADNAEKAKELQKADTQLDRYMELRRELRENWLPKMRIGSLARVLVEGMGTEAVITGLDYRHTPGKGNPYAASKISVRMLVNHPVRTLRLPLSKLLSGEGDNRIYVRQLTRNEIDLDTVFTGENLGGNRETRHIITENLLQGIDESRKQGLVISYSTSDGETKQGYLLPRSFKPEEDIEDTVLLKNPEEVLNFITRAREVGGDALRFGLRTRRKDTYVHILKSNRGVEIAVPRSKAAGKDIWGDQALLAIVGDFHSIGKTMRVTVPEQKVEAAIARFMQLEPLYVKRDLKEQLLGKPGSSPRFSRSESRGPVKGHMKAQRVKQSVADIAINVKARVRVVQSQTELPQHVLDKAAQHSDGADGIKGVYDEQTGRNGTIWLVADHLANPAEARRKFVHEVAHAGLRRLLKNTASLERTLKQIGRDIPKADLEKIAETYELDLTKPDDYLEAVEEAIAHYAESVERMPWLRKAWAKLRRWARRVFPGLRWSRNDIKELILASRKAAMKPAHEQYNTYPLMAYTGQDDSMENEFQGQPAFARGDKVVSFPGKKRKPLPDTLKLEEGKQPRDYAARVMDFIRKSYGLTVQQRYDETLNGYLLWVNGKEDYKLLLGTDSQAYILNRDGEQEKTLSQSGNDFYVLAQHWFEKVFGGKDHKALADFEKRYRRYLKQQSLPFLSTYRLLSLHSDTVVTRNSTALLSEKQLKSIEAFDKEWEAIISVSENKSLFARSNDPDLNLDQSEFLRDVGYLDKLLRWPFQSRLLGGVDERNRWTPAPWIGGTGKAALKYTGASATWSWVQNGQNAPED